MEVNDIYYQKYLKYKSKYIELKNLIDGGGFGKCTKIENGKQCTCKKFKIRGDNDMGDNKFCKTCEHLFNSHGGPNN